MKRVRLSLSPAQIMEFNLEHCIHSLCLLISILLIIGIHIEYLTRIPAHSMSFSGFSFDLLHMLPLVFLFWVVQCSHIDGTSYRILSIGLILWLDAATVDLLDEAFMQPLIVGIFIEDPLRLIGLVLCVIGLTRTMYYVCHIYNQLHGLALSDDLTRLPNRRRFRLALEDLETKKCAVIMIDLDLFKRINDSYGHDVGDMILQQFSQQLSNICPTNAIVARLGGEEFVLCTTDVSRTSLDELTDNIRRSAHQIYLSTNSNLTVSMGVAIRKHGESNKNLLSRADIALYQAKEKGRDRVEWA